MLRHSVAKWAEGQGEVEGCKGAVCINEWQINVEHVWNEHEEGGGGRDVVRQAKNKAQGRRQWQMGAAVNVDAALKYFYIAHTHTSVYSTHTHAVVCARFDSVF